MGDIRVTHEVKRESMSQPYKGKIKNASHASKIVFANLPVSPHPNARVVDIGKKKGVEGGMRQGKKGGNCVCVCVV